MAVYCEWHWSCDECEEHSEEPWGDHEAARGELADHMAEAHSTGQEPSMNTCGITGPHRDDPVRSWLPGEALGAVGFDPPGGSAIRGEHAMTRDESMIAATNRAAAWFSDPPWWLPNMVRAAVEAAADEPCWRCDGGGHVCAGCGADVEHPGGACRTYPCVSADGSNR